MGGRAGDVLVRVQRDQDVARVRVDAVGEVPHAEVVQDARLAPVFLEKGQR